MPRVVIADLGDATGPSRKKTSIRKKRIRGSDGKVRRIMILDLTSATFDDDLTYIFERNVAKARRENKKLLGSADGIKANKHRLRLFGG
jgi:hypothetical protein